MTTENESIPGATTALYARIAELELELQRSHTSARGLDERLGEQNARLTQALIELRDMRERALAAERYAARWKELARRCHGMSIAGWYEVGLAWDERQDSDVRSAAERMAHLGTALAAIGAIEDKRVRSGRYDSYLCAVSKSRELMGRLDIATRDRDAARHAADVASQAHAEAVRERDAARERMEAAQDERDRATGRLEAVGLTLADGIEGSRVQAGDWAYSPTLKRARELTADRDRLAAEVERLRGALVFWAHDDCLAHDRQCKYTGCSDPGMDFEAVSCDRARAALTPVRGGADGGTK